MLPARAAAILLLLAAPPAALAGETEQPKSKPAHSSGLTGLAAGDVVGRRVRTGSGNEIGTVGAVVVGTHGRILTVVIDLAPDIRAMGVDRQAIAVDSQKFTPAAQGEALVTDMTLSQLRTAPAFIRDGGGKR